MLEDFSFTYVEASSSHYVVKHNRYQSCFEVSVGRASKTVTVNVEIPNRKVKNICALMKDERGRYIWEGSYVYDQPSKDIRLTLGNDHKKYRIYVTTKGGVKEQEEM